MSRKRSDALQALVLEVVDLATALEAEREREEEARRESVAARQVLDAARGSRESAEQRLATTEQALRIIQQRDEVAGDTIEALMARAGSPRTWA